jgi:hypothetical protein
MAVMEYLYLVKRYPILAATAHAHSSALKRAAGWSREGDIEEVEPQSIKKYSSFICGQFP